MKINRNYNCKNEELVVICDYVLTSLQRDLSDFTAFSEQFNEEYITDYKAKIQAMRQIVFPQNKTNELKIVTARLYDNMNILGNLVDRLDGYIKLSKNAMPISSTDFGIVDLKKKIRSRDAEGVLKCLQQINSNIVKYSGILTKYGLSADAIKEFTTIFDKIDSDNQKQYEIISNRRILTAENINTFNAIYAQMKEICSIGKILYRKSQKEKLPDYTFAYLKKKVRVV